MPNRPLRLCAAKGCSKYIKQGSYCSQHKREAWGGPKPSASQRGYGADWRAKRIEVLNRDGWTCSCGQPATQVDHVIAKAFGGNDDPSNLRAICSDCHRVKTGKDSALGRRGR